jgi:3',5'-cyclic AMP phosphodiesterase CpdA
VLEALLADLARHAPDQVAITGDLTQIALEEEFVEAAAWLARVGPPGRVNAIPGNHDAYVPVSAERGWDHWSDYLDSDAHAVEFRTEAEERFPSVRVREGLALVGVCTAHPTAPLEATGTVGTAQLARLGETLDLLRARDLCRIVLIHHPPMAGVTRERRSLTDSGALGEVLGRHGAHLVLHGHLHRTHIAKLPGPDGDIPVVGVPSASHSGPSPKRCAAYHLYDIERADAGFEIRRRSRVWDPAERRFVASGSSSGLPLS